MTAFRGPLKYPGGKHYLQAKIRALFPPHSTYFEPFLGGGSVLLNHTTESKCIGSDTNAELIDMWRTIRDEPDRMHQALCRVSYSRETWDEWSIPRAGRDHWIDKAVTYIVRYRMSRGGLGKQFSWSDRLRGGVPEGVNAWNQFVKGFPEMAKSLAGVTFWNAEALEVLKKTTNPSDLFYLDPPYVPSTRVSRLVYGPNEMSIEDHAKLLSVIRCHPSMVAISGYPCDLYDTELRTWNRHDFPMPNHSGQNKVKQRRLECVWTNW